MLLTIYISAIGIHDNTNTNTTTTTTTNNNNNNNKAHTIFGQNFTVVSQI
jgi:hypothetical protein